jgi:hypothetical protein
MQPQQQDLLIILAPWLEKNNKVGKKMPTLQCRLAAILYKLVQTAGLFLLDKHSLPTPEEQHKM